MEFLPNDMKQILLANLSIKDYISFCSTSSFNNNYCVNNLKEKIENILINKYKLPSTVPLYTRGKSVKRLLEIYDNLFISYEITRDGNKNIDILKKIIPEADISAVKDGIEIRFKNMSINIEKKIKKIFSFPIYSVHFVGNPPILIVIFRK